MQNSCLCPLFITFPTWAISMVWVGCLGHANELWDKVYSPQIFCHSVQLQAHKQLVSRGVQMCCNYIEVWYINGHTLHTYNSGIRNGGQGSWYLWMLGVTARLLLRCHGLLTGGPPRSLGFVTTMVYLTMVPILRKQGWLCLHDGHSIFFV